MKNKRITFIGLLGFFIILIGLIIVQNAQVSNENNQRINVNLRENEVEFKNGLVYPDLNIDEIVLINIQDPVLESQVTLERSTNGIWRIWNDERSANQEYAESIGKTLGALPFSSRIGGVLPAEYGKFGLSPNDALLVVTAVMADESYHTFIVGNPVSTDENVEGFYAVVDDHTEVYILPKQPILYLVQYLQVFENTQKLDK